MKHLSTDEILDFVTLESLDEDGLALSKRVNKHIRSCPSCMQKVTAFLEIHDELEKIKRLSLTRNVSYRLVSSREEDREIQRLLKEVGENAREGTKLEL